MNFEQFKELAQSYTAIPVSRRMMADVQTPVSLFLSIREEAVRPFLLESVEGGEQLARYSFIGCNPYQSLIYSNGLVTLEKSGRKTETLDEDYFSALNRLTTVHSEPKLPDLPRLTGGAVGFSAYDTVRQIEHLPSVPDDDLSLPEAIWCFYDQVYAFDHVKQQIVLMNTVFIDENTDLESAFSKAEESLDEMEKAAIRSVRTQGRFQLDAGQLSSNVEEPRFHEMVNRSKEYIYEGDIFQVVLSQRFHVPFEGDRFTLYRALRMVNPSPYLFFLDFDDFALVGSSPEVLVRVTENEVRLLPIAGTRPRGDTHEKDLELELDLKNDPKEIAEHVMLVDLGRNDLSRVCKSGTVHLERNQAIERFSHVMHIVSDVVGEISPGKSSVDALMKCFPAGTVSGAPKIRAMEIIDELEPTKRGPYAGAVGYFDFSGNMDTCIAIRTMVVTEDSVYIQAGAGIVADSDPAKEFEETKNKAGALVEALSVALEITK
ncbi:anthranilate synthase component I [Rhodohalobacter mucosus]|uniref:Anthranilate synthase component 1 n=1 Tax=Rhodohalobacter mucosus TaxID=2079485 RepID=A0A316TWB9_9BACT|nr:anthranilate synthase component I [Rhodohalobacter mucosus]PWN07505.1 anthranilate synthase component I [Rhodohalobacter mucosus]